MANKIDEVRLEHTTQGHNKMYGIWLEELKPGQWVVNFHYGAIDRAPLQGTKTPSPVSLDKAKAIRQKLMAEKLAKGYVVVEGGTSYDTVATKKMIMKAKLGPSAVNAEPELDIRPALLTPGDEETLEKLIADPDWIAQQKMNGKRVVIATDTAVGGVKGYSRNGLACPIPSAVAMELGKYYRTVLDGEMIGDTYHAFDVMAFAGSNIRHEPYSNRRKTLEKLFEWKNQHVKILGQHVTTQEKRDLVEKLRKENQEGVVFKNINAGYVVGKIENLAKAIAVKVKFYIEGSFEVVSFNAKNSIMVGAYDEAGDLATVGNVTVPAKYAKQIKQGSVVRVRYLYATKASQLYQPTLCPDEDGMVVQDDVAAIECLLSRLKYEGKAEASKPGRSILLD